MNQMSLTMLLMISFPEAILVVALGLLLMGVKPRVSSLVLIGILSQWLLVLFAFPLFVRTEYYSTNCGSYFGIEELLYSAWKQKHDFNHHLQTIYGLLETGHHAQAKEYLRRTLEEISTTSA